MYWLIRLSGKFFFLVLMVILGLAILLFRMYRQAERKAPGNEKNHKTK